MLVERAQEGDGAAREALARIGESLGVAVGSLVNIFDPELTVVGGGFGAAAGEFVLEGCARGSAPRGGAAGDGLESASSLPSWGPRPVSSAPVSSPSRPSTESR